MVQIKEQDHIESDYSLRGNGLGLSITRSLVLLQGGVIDVQSKKGEGSAFRVCLPVHVEQAPKSLRDKSEPGVNPIEINLLVVDDHQMNRMVVSNLVKKFFPNAIITEAKNGTEALTKMRSELFDLVLMDLIMPDLTGTEVVEIIRKEAAPYSDVNVVALTANLANEALNECNRVRMQGVLPKPIDLDLLVQTITQFGTPKNLQEIH
jgi:CheY-like chemotaxis protein